MATILSRGPVSLHEDPIGHRLREHNIFNADPDEYIEAREFYPSRPIVAGVEGEARKVLISTGQVTTGGPSCELVTRTGKSWCDIDAGHDYAEKNGGILLTPSDSSQLGYGGDVIYIRFKTDIPRNATITAATLYLASTTDNGSCKVVVKYLPSADHGPSTAIWNDGDSTPGSGSGSVLWTIDTTGQTLITYYSKSVLSLVQSWYAIQSEHTRGSYLAFVISPGANGSMFWTNGPGNAGAKMAAALPRLGITYTWPNLEIVEPIRSIVV